MTGVYGNGGPRGMAGQAVTRYAGSIYDDEFDGSPSFAPWVVTPSAPNAMNSNSTSPGALYLRASGTASTFVGKYQPVPPAYPFTLIVKVLTTTARADSHKGGGICFLPTGTITSSSGCVFFGPQYNSGLAYRRVTFSSMSAFSSQSSQVSATTGPWYLKAVVSSATAVALYYSSDGVTYTLLESYTLPFSLGNIGVVCNEEAALGGVDTTFDYFRVT